MQATMAGIRLMEANFVALVTYKRDGTPVTTPVLSTPSDAGLLVRTHHTAGKLKRLRHTSAVELAPCDSRGRHLGAVETAAATILPPGETERCLALLHERHGFVGRLASWLRHLRGMRDVFIEVHLS
jgi:uncharacterized protein